MKNQCQNHFAGCRAGFTLLEIVVTIVVFSVLTAAAMVSWASFTRYQELRGDASAFHKELLAAKAKAMETDTLVKIKYTAEGYNVIWFVEDNSNPPKLVAINPPKVVKFNKKVKISATSNMTADGELPQLSPSPGGGIINNWKDSIVIEPDNLNTFESGRVIIETTDAKKIFCIQKDDGSIKPLMYYKNGGGSWKKI